MDASPVCEEQDIIMRGCHEQVFHKIGFLSIHTNDTAAAPALLPVRVNGHALDISAVGDCDHHIFHRYQVLILQVHTALDNLGAPGITIALPDICQFFLNEFQYLGPVSQQLE